MCKKVFLIFLIFSLSVLLIIPSYAVTSGVTIPESATPISLTWSPRFIYRLNSSAQWFSRNVSPLFEEFYSDNGVADDQIACIPCIIFSDSPSGTYYYLTDATTYYMEYVISTSTTGTAFLSYNTNPDYYKVVIKRDIEEVFGDFSSNQVTSSGLNDTNSRPLTFYASDTAIAIEANGSRTYKVTFAFTTNIGVSNVEAAAICMPSSGYLSNEDNVKITTFKAYSDPVGDTFNQLQIQIAQKQQESLDQINGKLDGIGTQLGDISDQLTGDPNSYQDNSGFDDAAGDLEDLEGQISDQISQDITDSDGNSYEVNGELIGGLKENFFDRWDPQDYEATVGREIARIFELFYPYVGVAIFLNLMLAVILSFLRGRSNA